MLTLTENARGAIRDLTAPAGVPHGAGIRIASGDDQPNGTGVALSMAVTPAPEPADEVLDDEGARVFLDAAAAQILGGQVLDAWVDDTQQVRFFARPAVEQGW
jgi:iron-sulfur cluster assembly protein